MRGARVLFALVLCLVATFAGAQRRIPKAASIDTNNTIRATGQGVATSGAGVEIEYVQPYGWIRAYDRTNNIFLDLYINDVVHIGRTGNITTPGAISAGTVMGAAYQDVAEWVPTTLDLAAGIVVVVDPTRNNAVLPSERAYDTRVAGVVSEHPGVLLGVASADKAKIATTGRVHVRVDATQAPICIGDLLVTSDEPGTAMKSIPVVINGRKFHQAGTIIGKALEPLPSGKSEILVLLSLQ